jgi:hypothetical protein
VGQCVCGGFVYVGFEPKKRSSDVFVFVFFCHPEHSVAPLPLKKHSTSNKRFNDDQNMEHCNKRSLHPPFHLVAILKTSEQTKKKTSDKRKEKNTAHDLG